MNLLGLGLNPMAASRSASLLFCCSCWRALLATSSCSSSSSLRPEPANPANAAHQSNACYSSCGALNADANTKPHLRWCCHCRRRRRRPSWARAAPAGWRRCSSTWAPNATMARTSAPVSVAPPPWKDKIKKEERERRREERQAKCDKC